MFFKNLIGYCFAGLLLRLQVVKVFALLLIVFVAGCSQVNLYSDSRRFYNCESIGIVSGTGASENERIADLKQQASALDADSVYLRLNYKGEISSQVSDSNNPELETISAEAFICNR